MTFSFKLRAPIAATLVLGFGCTSPEHPSSPSSTQPRAEWALAIHGGAGHFGEEDLNPEQQKAYDSSLSRALELGEAMLERGSPALDVVEIVVRMLEDDSLFNAGRGAVFTSEGTHELDASIADGATRNCGAVTGLQGYRHPISVARLVMDSSEHVFFSGHGAGEFARTQGAEPADASWFDTSKAYERYLRAAAREGDDPVPLEEKRGTVGCVALDASGNLAAATSTGGMTYKRHGRIGDSPVVGAGTWADNRTCAVSATGWGEYFIRTGVTQDIHSRMLHGNQSLQSACESTIFDEMGALGGDGGVVAVSADGQVALVFNSAGMFRASAVKQGQEVNRQVAMFGPYQR
ncbi:MAG: isoaspartyl peptidase/L-asparaginase [Bacteroidetes bacterium]|nr:isoaspartyl peptidase/L-asparaginase [Bacteroidota bacterium]MDA0903472.1 isoaspartyl peptidase/L-asparaginase [Bacteroidota bacterium]MDA1241943.1 isoaspartyl peptidase/L-asparaginase [Bacteroidota bacterium]